MARPRKMLIDLIRDGTFLARKDEDLLRTAEPLPWPELERFRQLYNQAPTPKARREVSLAVERILREPDRTDLLGVPLDFDWNRLPKAAAAYQRALRKCDDARQELRHAMHEATPFLSVAGIAGFTGISVTSVRAIAD